MVNGTSKQVGYLKDSIKLQVPENFGVYFPFSGMHVIRHLKFLLVLVHKAQ